MSKLKRNYEISIWDDVLTDDGEFQEVRWGVIGSDKMLSQSRALKPVLGRNINGCKTFQFEMYRFYVDNVTGERVENPFVEQLVSERKVKLKYKNKWYDFIIKDISENSSTHLYTYKLEDAFVQELSKNGFSVVLDESNDNSGTPKTLAEKVLENTDWKVESEVFVQKVEDALIYLTIPGGTPVVHLLDQDKSKLSQGVTVDSKITSIGVEGDNSYYTILAFYSSCTNKPHRFQFIYLDDLTKITTDKEGKINNSDCQYYIEIEPNNYEVGKNADGNEILPFYLPSGFKLCGGNNTGGYIYNDARAERYSFTHQSIYIPKLDRYVKKYIKEGVEYYGYQDSEYFSPALVPNLIANTKFDSTTGWIPTKTAKGQLQPKIRNVYGHFINGKFVDSADEILAGTFDPNRYQASTNENEKYAAYLEMDGYGALLNSGIKNNRLSLGNMDFGTRWRFEIVAFQEGDTDVVTLSSSNFSVEVKEYSYNIEEDRYIPDETNFSTNSSGSIFTVTRNNYKEQTFQKDSHVYVRISPNNYQKYYIKSCQFYRYIETGLNKYIQPDDYSSQVDWLTNNIVKNYYYYFSSEDLEEATSIKDLKKETADSLSYAIYKPVYKEGAEKVRSVSAKESNYFNILQSIAETFGAWMEIDVEHEEDGRIKEELVSGVRKRKKYIRYKNYIGNNNYAGFRYGVNLKDIQRTFASKEIVTKLMVKPNSNKHAQNGFCAVGRANSNPTGEDYIYDFRYFHEKGLLNSRNYLDDVYVYNDGENPNYETTSGYYYKIKDLNQRIRDLDENQIQPRQKDLLQLESEYELACTSLSSAREGIQLVSEDFKALTDIEINTEEIDSIQRITIDNINKWGSSDEEKSGHISYLQSSVSDNGTIVNLFSVQIEIEETTKIHGTITPYDSKDLVEQLKESPIALWLYPKITLKDGTLITKEFYTEIKLTEVWEGDAPFSTNFYIPVEIIDLTRSDIQKMIVEYKTLFSNINIYETQISTLTETIGNIKQEISILSNNLNDLKGYKKSLNLAFFKKYSRFIQEGTWIDEKYHDNELYYADSLSVMNNSCYPKVAYTINVLAIGELEGYEGFQFELGDTTYIEDYDFFGNNEKVEVVVTEFIEKLDEPDQDQIKVQNFKNQFKDLFQKITATVQQTQYSTGSYEKAVALAEANQQRKQQFLTDALNGVDARLIAAGQQSVVLDNTGLTITDLDTPSNQIRMIGGAILLKSQDKNGQEKWTTGITSDGISANLITAGTINAGEIAIMNADDPVFRWDAFGISAFDFTATEGEFGTTIGAINPSKFVRFDKYGIYGIDGTADGMKWHASRIGQIDELSTFALTWEGLKITGSSGGTARLGRQGSNIFLVKDSNGNETFKIDEGGNVILKGDLEIGDTGEYTKQNLLLNTSTDRYICLEGADGGYIADNDSTSVQNQPYLFSLWGVYSDASEFDNMWYRFSNNGGLYGLTEGQNYTFSGKVRFDLDNCVGTFEKLLLTCESNIKGLEEFFITNDQSSEWLYFEKSFTVPQGAAYFMIGLRIVGNSEIGKEWEFIQSLQFTDLKLEKGNQATAWCPSNKDNSNFYNLMNNNKDFGNFSWRFDMDKGITMWSGKQDDDNIVFRIFRDLEDNKKKLEMRGKILAKEGEIGGWNISASALHTTDNALYLGTSTITETIGDTSISNLVFKAGNNFGVTSSGALYSSYGNIAGFKISTHSLRYDTFTIKSGSLSTNSARISLGNDRGQFDDCVFYATTSSEYITTKQDIIEVSIHPSIYNKIKKDFDADGKQLLKYSWLIGNLGSSIAEYELYKKTLVGASDNILYIQEDKPNKLFIHPYWGNIGLIESFSIETLHITFTYPLADNFLPFSVTDGGHLNAATYGSIMIHGRQSGQTNANDSSGANAGKQYIFGIRDFPERQDQHLMFLWYRDGSGTPFYLTQKCHLHATSMSNDSGTITKSDINEKNTISNISQKYEIFFDNLQPITHKYNDGTSDRLHVGFIAQWVDNALKVAEISRQEFAGLCIDNLNTDKELWQLRYTEFIPINTWQIQKLKPRMTAAEEKIQQLEQEVAELKQELATFKNQ